MGTVVQGNWPAVVHQKHSQSQQLPKSVSVLKEEGQKGSFLTARKEYLRRLDSFQVICVAFMDERRDGNESSVENMVEQTKAFLHDTDRLVRRLGLRRLRHSYLEALLEISANLGHIVQLLAFPALSVHIYTLAMEQDCFEDIEMLLDAVDDCADELLE